MIINNPLLKNTTRDFDLNGNIESVEYKSYKAVGNVTDIISTAHHDARYPDNYYEYLRFKDNRLSEVIRKNTHVDCIRNTYQYDVDGIVSKETSCLTPTDKTQYYTITTKNDNSDFTEYIHNDSNGEYHGKTIIIQTGRQTECGRYDKNDDLKYRKIFIYNDQSKIIKEKTYSMLRETHPDKSMADFTPMLDNDNRRKKIASVEATYSELKEYLTEVNYKLDENGYLTETYFHHNSKHIYKNDANGNPLFITSYEDDRLTGYKKFEYNYDEHGNWTGRIEFRINKWNDYNVSNNKFIPNYIVQRKIIYTD